MADGWFSAAELAALKIAGLPSTERSINRIAAREGWESRDRNKRGGGREYPVAALPAAARAELAKRQIVNVPAVIDHCQTTVPAVSELKDHQRKRMEARASILALVDHLVEIQGHTRSKAIEAVVEKARNGDLPPLLQSQIAIANARSNSERTLTRATLFNWLKARDLAGGMVAALATKAVPEAAVPAWAEAFMQLWGRPSKPNLTEVLDAWPAGDIAKPSYDQARRFLKRLDAITRNKGRMGPRALKGLKAYIARDVSNLWPGAVFVGDGHTFKAEVAHPIHGRPFRPEVTAFIDVFTRKWVGWSAELVENTWAVADAARHAVTTTTCCDVIYYDNGSGANNKNWDEQVTGFCARTGITKLNSAPWSSQARGVIERFHSTVLHKLARTLPTYVGDRMDKEARQTAFKITRRDIAAIGSSKLLVTWDAFKAMLDSAQRVYNSTPHSFLPRVLGEDGRRHHQSPDQAWEAAVAAGWTPEPVPLSEARDLFRPAVTRSVQRGVIKLFNNAYFHPALETLHGEEVQVAFDLHDAQRVIVRLMDGRFVCEAEWNGNSRDFIPVAFAERAREKRIEGKLKRLDEDRDTALAEATPNLRLVAQAAPPAAELTERQKQIEAEIVAELEAPAPAAMPLDPDQEKDQRFRRALALEQQIAAGEALAEIDAAWLARYVKTPEYSARKAMLESFGDEFLSA